MTLGAVAFRLIEGVFYALSAAGTMILVSLSGQLPAGASAHASADLVRDLRDSAGCVGVLAFCTGATLYYLVFYRSQLIPRWLSVWAWPARFWVWSPACWSFSSPSLCCPARR
jgi:Domain of unknown function (DUF4386)